MPPPNSSCTFRADAGAASSPGSISRGTMSTRESSSVTISCRRTTRTPVARGPLYGRALPGVHDMGAAERGLWCFGEPRIPLLKNCRSIPQEETISVFAVNHGAHEGPRCAHAPRRSSPLHCASSHYVASGREAADAHSVPRVRHHGTFRRSSAGKPCTRTNDRETAPDAEPTRNIRKRRPSGDTSYAWAHGDAK